MILKEWLSFYSVYYKNPRKWCTGSALWLLHGWCRVTRNAAVSAQVLCTPLNHVPVYNVTSLLWHRRCGLPGRCSPIMIIIMGSPWVKCVWLAIKTTTTKAKTINKKTDLSRIKDWLMGPRKGPYAPKQILTEGTSFSFLFFSVRSSCKGYVWSTNCRSYIYNNLYNSYVLVYVTA